MSLRIVNGFGTHCAIRIHQLDCLLAASSGLKLRKNLTHSLLLFLRTLTQPGPASKGAWLHAVSLVALLGLVELVNLVLCQAVFRVGVIIRLLSLVSHTTIVTAVIVLLVLLVAVHSRNHLLHDVLLTLRPRFELIWLVVDNQFSAAIRGRGASFVILHDRQILLHGLRRVLQVYEIFEKPLVVF